MLFRSPRRSLKRRPGNAVTGHDVAAFAVDDGDCWWYACGVNDPVSTARRVAPILRALADENRLSILFGVAEEGRSVTELAALTGMAPSLVSHHLKTLRETGLVTMHASGRKNIYTLCCDAVAEPIAALSVLVDPVDAAEQEGLRT